MIFNHYLVAARTILPSMGKQQGGQGFWTTVGSQNIEVYCSLCIFNFLAPFCLYTLTNYKTICKKMIIYQHVWRLLEHMNEAGPEKFILKPGDAKCRKAKYLFETFKIGALNQK